MPIFAGQWIMAGGARVQEGGMITKLGVRRVRRRAVDPPPQPATGPLIDRFGRVATDLRVSLTDRCNLRCTYCMPAEGLDWLPDEQLIRPDELARLLRIAGTRLGIISVRFTGGEPLLARHLERADVDPGTDVPAALDGVVRGGDRE